eukprot:3404127-Pyramimonas_sp.AAC.1
MLALMLVVKQLARSWRTPCSAPGLAGRRQRPSQCLFSPRGFGSLASTAAGTSTQCSTWSGSWHESSTWQEPELYSGSPPAAVP